jgi:hypothetical protein
MRRPRCILLLLWGLAFCSPAIPGMAGAQCDTPVLSVHVNSILARETGSEIDQRLGPETSRLQALFDYSSYRLLRTDEADTPCGQEVAFFLPVERVLQVRPLATHGNLIALELALYANGRVVMRTQLKVLKGGLLVLVGSHNPQDAYITSLTIDSPARLGQRCPLKAARARPSPTKAGPITAK